SSARRWKATGRWRSRETGGREWESNPPGAGSLPQPDLKSGRPTGDDSLPSAIDEQVDAMRVYAPQIAAPQGHAEAIEEVEDLDRHLAAVVDAVAEGRRGEPAALPLRRDIGDDARHLARHLAREEMVMCDLVGAAELLRQFQHAPHVLLVDAERLGEVAHAGRAEAPLAQQAGADAGEQRLVLRRKLRRVAGQAHEGAVERDAARLGLLPQQREEGRGRQARRQPEPEFLAPDPGKVGIVGVERAERGDKRLPQVPHLPEADRPAGKPFRAGLDAQRGLARSLQAAVAQEGGKIDRPDRELALERRDRIAMSSGGEKRQPLRRAALARRRAQIEEAAAADGARGRNVAQDEAVAYGRRDRPV